MTWRNILCTDSRCDRGCWHLGPQGQQCWYQTEQKLCNILGLVWHQGLELDTLLTLIHDKIAQLPSPDDYAAQIKLAQRATTIPVLSATPEEEHGA